MVALAGFLLGTVSGSGVATTVMLGSVAWPMLRRAGYPKDTGGAVLSAAGIGAILSPPTLGAAAFLVPFVFTLDPRGMGMLLRGSFVDVAWTSVTAGMGVVALAMGFGGWIRRAASAPERMLAIIGGALLFYPTAMADAVGIAFTFLAVTFHVWRTRRAL